MKKIDSKIAIVTERDTLLLTSKKRRGEKNKVHTNMS